MNDSRNLPPIDRRRLLNGAALLGVAAPVLAACGSGEEPSSSTRSEDEPQGSSDPSQGGGGGDQEALASTGDVPVGGGVILEGERIVVTQPAEGEFKAFSAVCTHQNCTVTSVEENTIECVCHGSEFSAEDGSVVNGPATAPLDEISVQVENGSVVRS